MSASKRDKRGKWRMEKQGAGTLNPLKVSGLGEDRGNSRAASLHVCDQKQQSQKDPWYLGDRVLWCPPGFCLLSAVFPQEHLHRCLPRTWGVGVGSCYYAKSWKVAKMHWNSLSNSSPGSCKPSIDSRLPSSYIRQILPVQFLSEQGNRFLTLSTPPSS